MSRVGQIDASILDSELQVLLENKVFDAFKYFKFGNSLKSLHKAEVGLVIKLIIFKLTIWDNSATYGAKLQNLKLVDARAPNLLKPMSRNQKLLYGLAVVGGSYFWSKIEDYLSTHPDDGYSRPSPSSSLRLSAVSLTAVTDWLSTAWGIASLANFLQFLYSGKYTTLLMRILRIQLSPAAKNLSRNVNFEFQNRQMVWNAFTEFLLFILPLFNLKKISNKIRKLFVSLLLGNTKKQSKPKGELEFLGRTVCPVCYEQNAKYDSITNPYVAECGHVYCYVCLKIKLEEAKVAGDDGWQCLRCSETVTTMQPYVDIEPSSVVDKRKRQLTTQEMKGLEKATPVAENTASEKYNAVSDSDDEMVENDDGFIVEDDEF